MILAEGKAGRPPSWFSRAGWVTSNRRFGEDWCRIMGKVFDLTMADPRALFLTPAQVAGSGSKKPPRADQHAVLRAKLERAVGNICPAWLRAQQDDLVQTAMMAVLRQAARREPDRPFPASYLRRAAYTALVDEIRRLRSRGEVPLETVEDQIELIEGAADPERSSLSSELGREIRDCLQGIAASRRSAVILRLVSDYKVRQIASRMGWRRKQAENLIYRGLQDLRRCLRTKGIEA